jgi:hypothetical protein
LSAPAGHEKKVGRAAISLIIVGGARFKLEIEAKKTRGRRFVAAGLERCVSGPVIWCVSGPREAARRVLFSRSSVKAIDVPKSGKAVAIDTSHLSTVTLLDLLQIHFRLDQAIVVAFSIFAGGDVQNRVRGSGARAAQRPAVASIHRGLRIDETPRALSSFQLVLEQRGHRQSKTR